MKKRHSYIQSEFRAIKNEEEQPIIEGYFIKYNSETELWDGVFEEIHPDAVVKTLKEDDIRGLFNHDTSLVLGRTGNSTLTLKSDDVGLFGTINVNEDDPQAMGAYARIKRGDVTGCSFGFMPTIEEVQNRDDGTIKYIVKEMTLFEVSPCTFPAYPQAEISARKKDIEAIKKEKLESRKKQVKERVKNYG